MADSSSEKKYKTVLAPNAPWPEVKPHVEKPKFKHKSKPVRAIPPPKKKSRIARTDEKFEEWRAKNEIPML